MSNSANSLNSNPFIVTIEQMAELINVTKIGIWIWYLKTDKVVYSAEYMELLGYEQFELEHTLATWEKLTLAQDLDYANNLIDAHLTGKSDSYEAEFRMIRKDGSITWMTDKGRITHYDEDGNPLVFCGVMQNIDRIKSTEDRLREHSSLLNLIINISGFGSWDWDLVNDTIRFNAEYIQMLGLSAAEMTVSKERRLEMIHEEDYISGVKVMNDYLAGKVSKYEHVVRLKHADGHYIWTRDIGRIIERDADGKPTRLMGGHLNIDRLMRAQEELGEALEQVENYQTHLERQIEIRTKSLVEHDKMLTAVNSISQKLVAFNDYKNLKEVMSSCLLELNSVGTRNRVSVWRITEEGQNLCAKMAFESNLNYVVNPDEIKEKFETANIESITEGRFTKDQKTEFYQFAIEGNNVYKRVNLDDHLPTIAKYLKLDKVLNSHVRDFTPLEQFYMSFQNVHSILVTPIHLNGELWGFMMLSDDKEAKLFNEIEENMLRITGSLFANAVQKAETDEELIIAHEEALMSSKAKSNFLANMSHEIRTPMNAISGMAEVLLRESTNSKVAEYASSIKVASNSLLTIINDILDISKIESGKVDIVSTEYHLPSMLNDIINIARMRLDNKPLIFFTFIDSTLPSILIGDEIRIKQIVINILNNAIKFTPSGHIILRVTGEHRHGKAEIVFEVIDTGTGIKEEDMGRLFEEFERVNTKKNRNIEGTGLGLAISKKLCEMMNGSIEAQSVFGEGSTFTMRIEQDYQKYLPIAFVAEEKKILLYESRELYIDSIKNTIENLGSVCEVCTNQSELYEMLNEKSYDYIFTPSLHLKKVQNLVDRQKLEAKVVLLAESSYTKLSDDEIFTITLPAHCMQVANALNNTASTFSIDAENLFFIAPSAKILIVDDNPVNLKVATELMRPYEFAMETAQNGVEAVAKIKNTKYDLVFMDHMMPEMDGIDATIAVRSIQEDYFQNLPIIALTANAIVGTKELFTGEGMNDFLAKPIEISKLNEILSQWLPQDKIIPTVPMNKIVQSQDHNLQIDNIDIDYGVKMLGGNFDNYIDIAITYYKDGIKKLPLINEYYQQKNLQAYKTEVHAIKSASASIGALDLSSHAAKLEDASTKEDWHFIDKNNPIFIEDFSILLEDLRENLKPYTTIQESGNTDKEEGQNPFLLEHLEKLTQAIQFVDISQIENIFEILSEYNWNENVALSINEAKQCIASYEYDEALPHIEDIIKSIS